MRRRGAEVGRPAGGRHLRRQPFELAAADVFEVPARRVRRRLLVEVHRHVKPLGDRGAGLLRQRHAVGHRRAFDRDEGHDVDRAHARVFAAVRAQIDIGDRALDEREWICGSTAVDLLHSPLPAALAAAALPERQARRVPHVELTATGSEGVLRRLSRCGCLRPAWLPGGSLLSSVALTAACQPSPAAPGAPAAAPTGLAAQPPRPAAGSPSRPRPRRSSNGSAHRESASRSGQPHRNRQRSAGLPGDRARLLQEEGLDVRGHRLSHLGEMIAPRGQLDVGLGRSTRFFNSVAQGIPLKIVADKVVNATKQVHGLDGALGAVDSGQVEARRTSRVWRSVWPVSEARVTSEARGPDPARRRLDA